jgi:endoglycosylceramidase
VSGRRPVVASAALLACLAACGGSAGPGSTSSLPSGVTQTTAATAALPAPPGADPSSGVVGPLRAPGGRFLVDRYGRAVIIHGVNLVYKVPPYEVTVDGSGTNVLTAQEAQTMASLGFDVVRLGIIWKGLEPGTAPMDDPSICTPGAPRAGGAQQFDAAVFDAYLQRLDATIALLGRYGISSIVDMHQDVYSGLFGGEGAPDWAVCTDGAVPKPQLNVPDWSVNLKGPGVTAAYEHFWRNDVTGDLQGEFDDLWAKVAAHLANDPWVAGYDPFNEPWGPGLAPAGLGTTFDAQLQCFYAGRAHPGRAQNGRVVSCPPDDPATGVIPRIETADPNHLVFYEGNFTTDSGPANHIGPMPEPRLVLNFHDYCFLHVPNGPEPPDFGAVCGPLENEVFVQHATQSARDATDVQPGGIPTFLTEFGATTDAADLGRIAKDADAHLTGWTYWQWLLYDDPTGSHTSGLWPPSATTPTMLAELSRPYPSAVAGTPTSISYDPTSGDFTTTYRSNPHITEPTVVSVPLWRYPAGYCATAAGGTVTSAPGASDLDVDAGAKAGVVTVRIAAGPCPDGGA